MECVQVDTGASASALHAAAEGGALKCCLLVDCSSAEHFYPLLGLRSFEASTHFLSRPVADRTGADLVEERGERVGGRSSRGFVEPPKLTLYCPKGLALTE